MPELGIARIQKNGVDTNQLPTTGNNLHALESDGSIKLALDSKEWNSLVSENKYQMSSFEDLMDRRADMF